MPKHHPMAQYLDHMKHENRRRLCKINMRPKAFPWHVTISERKKHDTLLSCEKFDYHMERKFLEDRQLKRKSACTGFSTKLRDQGHCRMINT